MNLSGSPIDYLIAFLGGVVVSLTPCVYPLIPVTAGYIGAISSGSKIRGLALSLIYVCGLAVTYSILGLLAVLTGSIFGRISSHPLTFIFVGVVIMLFGLSMLDLIQIPFINKIKLPTLKKKNYFFTFLVGGLSGLVVSPCLTPILGSILVYLTTKKSLLYGATLLFTFAYGMGLLLIIIGTSSGILVNLPKSGRWMLYIKRTFAIILLGSGLYFIFIAIRRI